jgi:hypothetical protein
MDRDRRQGAQRVRRQAQLPGHLVQLARRHVPDDHLEGDHLQLPDEHRPAVEHVDVVGLHPVDLQVLEEEGRDRGIVDPLVLEDGRLLPVEAVMSSLNSTESSSGFSVRYTDLALPL